jgi:hypothetical protein
LYTIPEAFYVIFLVDWLIEAVDLFRVLTLFACLIRRNGTPSQQLEEKQVVWGEGWSSEEKQAVVVVHSSELTTCTIG